jgi:site-specific DNA-methyltransferase (adenine-specific)
MALQKKFRLSSGRDAVRWLRLLEDESVDLVCTDIAYESLEKHRKRGTTTRLKNSKASSNKWFKIFPNKRFPELMEQCYRVLKPGHHIYFFSDAETMFVLRPAAEEAGFTFGNIVVWDKISIGTGYSYRYTCEYILFFFKGKKKQLNSKKVPNIIHEKRIWRGYPTEKPVPVNRVLIEQSTQPGELVIDPFMGSGSCGVAALETGRRFWGNDLCREAVRVTRGRLKQAKP